MKNDCIVLVFNVLLISFLSVFSATAQTLKLPIQNYSSVNYSAASQNWDIALNEEGVLFSANNKGLLVFDGLHWQLYTLNSESIIRSLYCYKDRVYTGSYKEFGYWKRTKFGDFKYHSLADLFSEIDLADEEFWGITSFNDTIYFRSFAGLYKYDGEHITKVTNGVITGFTVFNGEFYFAKVGKGLFKIKDEKPVLLFPNADFNNTAIKSIIPFQQSLLIATENEVFQLQDDKLAVFASKYSEFFQQSELNKLLNVSNEKLVFGTVKNGILIYDVKNNTESYLSRNSGLQNNTVLSMAYGFGNLWLGLDNGIDRLDVNSPISFYKEPSGILGAVYDVNKLDGTFLLASNTGVYQLNEEDLQLINGLKGHSWNLEKFDTTIYSNSNDGTYEISKGKVNPIDTSTGSFTVVESQDNAKFIGTYTGVGVLKNNTFKRIPGVSFPVKQIVIEDSNTLWLAHAYEGIYKAELNLKKGIFGKVTKLPSLDTLQHYNPKIYKINNQISIYSRGKWYKYNPFKDELEDFKELSSFDNHRLLYQKDTIFWFVNTKTNNLIYTNLKKDLFKVSSKFLKNRLVKGNEQVFRETDSTFLITLKDGFARINMNSYREDQKKLVTTKPFISKFESSKNKYPINQYFSIPFKEADKVTIGVGLPISDSKKLSYELIRSTDTLKGMVTSGDIQFQNLSYGDYELLIESFTNHKKNEVEKFQFTVLPPWYLSNWMKLCYFIIFLAGIVLIYFYNRYRLHQHQKQIEDKFEKEHKERVSRLEKERLLDEIKLKRKELANSTMVAAKKNEILMEIQGELNKEKGKFNEYRLKNITRKINAAVKNKDEWQVFETNFNELHEDFFKNILATYPKLTNKDLKLCAYLKMNLSSKEIAPLMGISIRGVEVHRYRLRKKIDLDKNVNLTNYLIKNF
ncbi:histidine kinase [Zunongwangia sp.]|uniref:helix-turn-helix and ligand-binding sensor domain-containing protein n=1 Tax=Zunongwangia sp. TaxID=1965325 RepID=UPI003AA98D45